MIIPFDCGMSSSEIKKRIDAELQQNGCNYDTIVTFDYE